MASTVWRHAIENHALSIRNTSLLLINNLVKVGVQDDGIDKRIGTIRELADAIFWRRQSHYRSQLRKALREFLE